MPDGRTFLGSAPVEQVMRVEVVRARVRSRVRGSGRGRGRGRVGVRVRPSPNPGQVLRVEVVPGVSKWASARVTGSH